MDWSCLELSWSGGTIFSGGKGFKTRFLNGWNKTVFVICCLTEQIQHSVFSPDVQEARRYFEEEFVEEMLSTATCHQMMLSHVARKCRKTCSLQRLVHSVTNIDRTAVV